MSINRFGISFLSRSRSAEAENEEVMINKQTGEVSLKGLGGEIISYDKLARFRDHFNRVTALCHTVNVLGDMHEVGFDAVDLPEVISEDVNILDGDVDITSDTKVSKLLVSLDIDSLKIVAPVADLNVNQPTIEMTILLETNTTQVTTETLTVTLPLDELNTHVIIPEYTVSPGDVIDYSAKITSITLTRNASDLVGDDLRHILNSIIFVVKEEV